MKTIFKNKRASGGKFTALIVAGLLMSLSVFSQQLRDVSLPSAAAKYCYPNSRLNLLHFRENNQLQAATFFTDHKDVTGLQADDEMRLIRTEIGQGAISHYRFDQFYKGVPVEFISYTLHEKKWSAC
jgi:Zn-dependent metalloprotease